MPSARAQPQQSAAGKGAKMAKAGCAVCIAAYWKEYAFLVDAL